MLQYLQWPWDKSLIKQRKPHVGTERGWTHAARLWNHFGAQQASRGSGYHCHEYSWLLPLTSDRKFCTYKSRPVNNEEKGVGNSPALPRTTCNLTYWRTWKPFPILQGDSWTSLKVIFLCFNLHATKRKKDITQHCRINSYCGNYWFDVKAN